MDTNQATNFCHDHILGQLNEFSQNESPTMDTVVPLAAGERTNPAHVTSAVEAAASSAENVLGAVGRGIKAYQGLISTPL